MSVGVNNSHGFITLPTNSSSPLSCDPPTPSAHQRSLTQKHASTHASRPEPNDLYRPLKLVKRGFRDLEVPLNCGIIFDTIPSWFSSLRLSDWQDIYMLETDEVRLRQYHLPTWEFVKD